MGAAVGRALPKLVWALLSCTFDGGRAATRAHNASNRVCIMCCNVLCHAHQTPGPPSHTCAGFRLRVHAIRQRLDEELRGVLQAALLLLGPEDKHGHHHYSASTPDLAGSAGHASSIGAHHHMSVSGSLAGLAGGMARTGNKGNRAPELEPFVQAKCSELASTLAAMLQGRLVSVGSPSAGVAGAAAAERVLVVGRVCSALATESRCARVCIECT